MIIISLSLFDNFKCLSSDCPYSCCIGWDVPLDSRTACLYSSLNDSFGKKLSNSIIKQNENDLFIKQIKGRCAFLDNDKLCEIQKKLGENFLCNTCRAYPFLPSKLNPELLIFSPMSSCPSITNLVISNPDNVNLIILKKENAINCEDNNSKIHLYSNIIINSLNAFSKILFLKNNDINTINIILLSIARNLDMYLQCNDFKSAEITLNSVIQPNYFALLHYSDVAKVSTIENNIKTAFKQIIKLFSTPNCIDYNFYTIFHQGINHYYTYGYINTNNYDNSISNIKMIVLFSLIAKNFENNFMESIIDTIIFENIYRQFSLMISASIGRNLLNSEKIILLCHMSREFIHNDEKRNFIRAKICTRKYKYL